MGDILRRRALMLPGESLPAWDYEWDYTMGAPEDNGWTKSTSGTVSNGVSTTGYRFKNSSGGYNLRSLSALPNDVNTGVLEAKMTVRYRASNAGGWGKLGFARSGYGVGVLFSCQSSTSGKIYAADNSTGWEAGTQIGTYTSAKFKVVRLVLNNGVGSIYLDGVKVLDNINPTSINGFVFCQFGSAYMKENNDNHYAEYEYVKIKVGRL